MNKHST